SSAPTIHPRPLHDALPISSASTSKQPSISTGLEQQTRSSCTRKTVSNATSAFSSDSSKRSSTSTKRRTTSCPRSPANQFGSGCRSEEHTSELQSPDHLVCR